MRATAILLTLLLLVSASSAATLDEETYGAVPGRYEWKFVEDYYDTDGTPDLSAYLLNDEVRAGQATQINIVLQNTGTIGSYVVDTDQYPDNQSSPDYQRAVEAAKMELKLERESTTAKAITLTLDEGNAPLTVKTRVMAAGILEEGRSSQPIPFNIEVDDSARPGTYTLNLTSTYTYLRDAAVEAEADGSLSHYFDHATRTQDLTLEVRVTSEATFEAESNSTVPLDGSGVVNVSVTNTGDEVAGDAVARLIARYPLAADDDQAYIGSLAPGETRVVQFRVSTEEDASQKEYPVSLRVDYEDEEGHRRVESDVHAAITVGPPRPLNPALIIAPIALLILAGVVLAVRKRRG